MRHVLLILLFSGFCFGQSQCTVSDLKIGSQKQGVLSELKQRGCDLKVGTFSNRVEDDVVLNSSDERYSYYEVIFEDGKLAAVWSYSPVYGSAEQGFAALYQELVLQSEPAKAGGQLADVLGMRTLPAQVLLSRPLREGMMYIEEIAFALPNGRVALRLQKSKDGTVGVEVAVVRSR